MWSYIISPSVIIFYRLSSMYKVYTFSHNISDAILQFMFDFYLLKIVWVNIYKMKSYKALPFVKIIRDIEGLAESSFESILALIFILKFGTTTITTISFIGSIYSIVSRRIFSVSSLLVKDAHSSGLSFTHFFNLRFDLINKHWIQHVIFKTFDIGSNILGLAVFWYVLGPFWMAILFFRN